jgi:hypothetical protein
MPDVGAQHHAGLLGSTTRSLVRIRPCARGVLATKRRRHKLRKSSFRMTSKPFSICGCLARCQTRRLHFQHPYHRRPASGSPIWATFIPIPMIFIGIRKNTARTSAQPAPGSPGPQKNEPRLPGARHQHKIVNTNIETTKPELPFPEASRSTPCGTLRPKAEPWSSANVPSPPSPPSWLPLRWPARPCCAAWL